MINTKDSLRAFFAIEIVGYKPYWLRVPPATKSAREAVAWTFGIEKPEHYVLEVET